ncbi:DUF3718 domain-containing protein [Paraglaciecola sp. L3A3]|uniref:DUF3718 domain-containing protein n=1 Tax=Paraglaciecola sp. L3A3 TaxID=2686358 RepID=UPI00131B66BD|nr:DUF3718 domain-containing protein [Paraglaciecola sp. L3A3]
MLNIVKTTIVIATTSLIFAGNAQADVNEALQNICTIVKADDKTELRKKMKMVETDFSLKIKDYYAGVSCGGNSLIRTAMLSNAVETGTLIVKKMPKSDLSTPEQDGKTVSDWAIENGLADSALAAVLKARI